MIEASFERTSMINVHQNSANRNFTPSDSHKTARRLVAQPDPLEESSRSSQTEVERELVRKSRDPNVSGSERDEALNSLMDHNLPHLRRIAKKFAWRCKGAVDEDDLVSVAWFELLAALDAFDPAYGVRLVTYARPCIVHRIKKLIDSEHRSVTNAPTWNTYDADEQSADLPIESQEPAPQRVAELNEQEEQVRLAVESLPEKMCEIVKSRMGLCGCEEVSYAELGRRYKCSGESVRKQYIKAKNLLESRLAAYRPT